MNRGQPSESAVAAGALPAQSKTQPHQMEYFAAIHSGIFSARPLLSAIIV